MKGLPSASVRVWVVRCARRHALALRLAGCFAAVSAATLWAGLENGGHLIWVANGLILAYLLLAPRWRWPYYIACGLAAEFAGGFVLHSERWSTYLILATLNVAEASIGAFLLRKRSADLPHFTQQRYLIRFFACAVLGAPVAMGLVFMLAFSIRTPGSHWDSFATWVTTDGLGTAITTPAYVALLRARPELSSSWKSHWFCPLLLVAVTLGAFLQTRVPLLLFIYPLVGMILFRHGQGWASLSTLFVAAVGGWCTLHGIGPFAKTAAMTVLGPTVCLQLYVACGMFMVFAASSVMENLQATERKLQKIVALHHLVTENSRDVILFADLAGRRNYVSPAAGALSGWTREQMLQQNSLEMLHPDDLPRVRKMLAKLHRGAPGALIEVRYRLPNGQYLWIEANLRVVRDPHSGQPVGFLSISRDISERKRAELALSDAYNALEALAVTDPLTHLANRRRFDQYLSAEWRRGIREKHPLSLLLLDVDLFKSYNDTYGHLRGDGCLKQIAESAMDVVTRSGDLLARFGGEEFVVVLPNTGSKGAAEVAQQICEAVRRRNLPHSSNPTGLLTLSVGCATMLPRQGRISATLIQRADDALYCAKRNGRNRVCTANDEEDDCSVWQAS